MTEYETATGMIYAVREPSPGKYHIMCKYPKSRFWNVSTDPKLSAECNMAESLQEVLDAYAQRKGWALYEPADPCDGCKCKACGDNSCMQAHCDGSDHGSGCIREDGCYVPAEPAAEGSEPTESALAANPATSDLSQPAAFDYSGLDAQTVADLHLAEREYAGGKRMAEMGLRRMADGVAIAHDALCGTVVHNVDNGQFDKKEDTFRRWCESVGVGKSTAYKLLHVSYFLDQSTPEEQKLLEQLSPSLLYAGAKPSADPEMVQDLKDGKIRTLKEWNQREEELKAQLKAKDDELAAEKSRADSLSAEIGAREEKISELLEASEQADQRANQAETRIKGLDDSYRTALANEEFAIRRAADAEAKAREAESQLAGARQVAEAARLRADRWKEKAEAAQAQAAPATVEAVVDQDEVDRLAEEKARALAAQQAAESVAARGALQDRIDELEQLLDDAAQDQIANTQALAVQAVEACESLIGALFGHILMLPDTQYLPAKHIVESFSAKLGWALDNNDWPDERAWAWAQDQDDEDEMEEDGDE